MTRLHLHLPVNDLRPSIRFDSILFGAEPGVLKDDYARWMLDDPRVNSPLPPVRHGRGWIMQASRRKPASSWPRCSRGCKRP